MMRTKVNQAVMWYLYQRSYGMPLRLQKTAEELVAEANIERQRRLAEAT